ncbi:MAG: TIGR01777 family protein, partial [Myxococcales bacterium]
MREPGCESAHMRILIAGSSGFLGRPLQGVLRARGHQVVPLVRRPARAGEETWDPTSGHLDPRVLDGIDVVINLAGSPTLGNPHSSRWAESLRETRVWTTSILAEAIAASQAPPALLAGNGISWYGDHGGTKLDESAGSVGDAFLTRVTQEWQAGTTPAAEAGARVVVLRTAPGIDRDNAPLKQMLTLFRAGLGGRLGSGRQYFPIISARDWRDAVAHLVESQVSGPVNLCAPEVPTNAEFTQALAKAVDRPAFAHVPAIAITVAAGRMAPEVLGSVRAV